MTATERRAVRAFERAMQRAAWAPHGLKRQRERELQEFVTGQLERELLEQAAKQAAA